MAISVTLSNGKSWRTKDGAKLHFTEMLARHAVGERVIDETDHSDLLALLSVYDDDVQPGQPTKAGAGVAYFEKGIDTDRPYKSKCFFVVRRDGSKIDFSLKEAINSAAKASQAAT